MGLFSRKDSAPLDANKGRTRVSVSSEAQAAQLRGRARRRLVGAVALVLAAVIVLPMMLDSEPVPVASDIPILIPERNRPHPPQFADTGVAASGRQAAGTVDDAPLTPPAGATVRPPAPPQPPAGRANTPTSPTSPTSTPASRAAPAMPAAAPPRPDSPSAPPRTDDGSRAIAMLEGRVPPDAPRASASRSTNAYVLQIAAYSAQADAVARRNKLKGAGVGNAFVETATVNGKQQYRLRVGPFPTREAAQAAQARLRTLGYDNGFIAPQ